MTRIVVDALLREKLQDLAGPLELCDDAGKVLARVMPVYDPEEYGPLDPPISEEELDRRSKSNERRYTTDEVLRHLEQL
ncbi:MAG TPA: hypothetical protein VFI31_00105 [Pirellulales bacterium]|nr:hypothetical protein [Pirellulales bacterium]